MLKELLKPEIEELIEEHRWRELKDVLIEWNPSEVALLLESLKVSRAIILFRLLPKEFAYEVFSYLPNEVQEKFLKELTDEEVIKIVEELDPDDRTSLFEELPAELVQKLLLSLSDEEREKAIKLLGYPENSVGRRMTTEFLTIKPEFTREEALEYIRLNGKKVETIDILYVVDNNGKLIDDININHIVLADPGEKIEKLLDGNYVYLSAYDDQEIAIRKMKQYDYPVLPVIDRSGVLVGIVTFDDIFDLYQEETTEDIHKIASVLPIDISYKQASSWHLFSKRIIWLAVLLVIDLASSKIIQGFSYLIAAVTALAFFMPVLVDTAGNTGSQIATIIIRALALGELRSKDIWKTILKEIAVSLIIGITLAILIFSITQLWHGIDIKVSVVVGLSMFAVIIWSNLVGLWLPIILNVIRIDPAVASSPLITSIADISGLFIYFLISKAILGL